MGARVIPEARAKHYAKQGLRPAQIRDALAREGYTNLSVQAVYLWMQRRGIAPAKRRDRYDDLIPWTPRPEHRDLYVPKMLRVLGRSRKGIPLTPSQERALARFLKKLKDMDAVIHYDGDTEEGWFLIPREDQDEDVIRRPVAA